MNSFASTVRGLINRNYFNLQFNFVQLFDSKPGGMGLHLKQ